MTRLVGTVVAPDESRYWFVEGDGDDPEFPLLDQGLPYYARLVIALNIGCGRAVFVFRAAEEQVQ